jgi:hypothetical protein
MTGAIPASGPSSSSFPIVSPALDVLRMICTASEVDNRGDVVLGKLATMLAMLEKFVVREAV